VAALLALLATAAAPAWAGSLRFCDQALQPSAAQQDLLFRFAGLLKDTLETSGQRVALVSRSGLDLHRLQVRYSHAGISLRASPNAPWSVRQLYYACAEDRPRLFDQGLPGFVLGTDDPTLGYVSIVFLPDTQAAALEAAALDKRQALALLGAEYSANAYPFSTRYQNCNQWVAELLATAWRRPDEGPPRDPPGSPTATESPNQALDPADDTAEDTTAGRAATRRAAAQQWLARQGFIPHEFDLSWPPLMALGAFIPWVHSGDHPAEDLADGRYRVSLPTSIEAFVRRTVPGASRIELCHTGRQVVIHRGWTPIGDACRAEADDTVVVLD
jgi:hypothetical protein